MTVQQKTSANFEEHFLKVFGRPFEMACGAKFYEKDKEMLHDKTRSMMSGTIEKLLQIDETTAACEARVLAIHYSVLDEYKK